MNFKKLKSFEIEKKTKSVNYRLKLSLHFRVHLVFYVLLLEPVKNNLSLRQDVELQPDNDPEVYNVKKILEHKVEQGQRMYLIKWKGFPNKKNS